MRHDFAKHCGILLFQYPDFFRNLTIELVIISCPFGSCQLTMVTLFPEPIHFYKRSCARNNGFYPTSQSPSKQGSFVSFVLDRRVCCSILVKYRLPGCQIASAFAPMIYLIFSGEPRATNNFQLEHVFSTCLLTVHYLDHRCKSRVSPPSQSCTLSSSSTLFLVIAHHRRGNC